LIFSQDLDANIEPNGKIKNKQRPQKSIEVPKPEPQRAETEIRNTIGEKGDTI
jgi:hypothetical protein